MLLTYQKNKHKAGKVATKFLSDTNSTKPNGPVLTVSNTMRNVMASAAESEIGAAFVNAQSALPLRQALIDPGHS